MPSTCLSPINNVQTNQMLFSSIEFAFFLPIVFVLYWFVFNNKLRYQNCLVLIASYVFYGWWDWRFLSLILFSSILDYYIGINLGKNKKDQYRKLLLCVSIFVNIGFLAVFKYYNFFVDNFIAAFSLLGVSLNKTTLNILLPVGISFYTFQTLSYSIDIYRRKLEPTKDWIAFFAFVSFFPQLVAGPIERASNLLPQFYKKRTLNYALARDGLRQILWGLFKKMVIADNCALLVNEIFSDYGSQSGMTLWIGAILFAFQIYGDFSGYSDIAIGTARLFGFNLMQNFAFPYFSRDMAEFWRRWHISLSTWFRDYVYIPLGGSRGSSSIRIRNTFIIFIVSGFWHGANWTFIVWGALNALYFLPLMLTNKNRLNTNLVAEGSLLPSFKEICQLLVTFFLTIVAWIFFRSDSVSDAIQYLYGAFSFNNFFGKPSFLEQGQLLLYFLPILILTEWLQRDKQHALELMEAHLPKWIRWGIYYILILLILGFSGSQQDFIYFQF